MAFWSNISAILFLVTLILLILCIISLFKKNGKAMKYGRPAVICLIISLLVSATITTQTNHPVVGFFANLCLILFFFFLVLAILSIIKKTGMAKKQFLITGGLLMAFVVLATIATPSTEKVSVKDKKLATEQEDKKDVDKKKELAKKEADEKTQKLEEEQKRQVEEQARKQKEEQQRQAAEQASQKKSTVASAPTSNQGGANGQPFQNNPSDDKETNTSCKGQIKGNANSKKYHVPGGQYYDSTKDNIVWFCSETDAQAAGYVKSKK
ncbi:calcium-binding protein [Bacillus cereus]|nr:calcium-binding protein [Bacillus cereus]